MILDSVRFLTLPVLDRLLDLWTPELARCVGRLVLVHGPTCQQRLFVRAAPFLEVLDASRLDRMFELLEEAIRGAEGEAKSAVLIVYWRSRASWTHPACKRRP